MPKRNKKNKPPKVYTFAELRKKGGYMSASQLAAAIGISKASMSEAIQTGRVPADSYTRNKAGHYKIDVVKAVNGLEALSDSSVPAANQAVKQAAQEGAEVKGDVSDEMSINGLKRRRLQVQLQQDLIELQVQKGKFIKKNDVYSALYEFGQVIRAKMQQIPAAIVDDVMSARSRKEAESVIDSAIYEALKDLTDVRSVKLDSR